MGVLLDGKMLSSAMLAGGRDIMDHDTSNAGLDLMPRIDAEDGGGVFVDTLRFKAALAISRGQVRV